MGEGVLVLGPSGNIRRWNKAFVALFPHIASVEGKALIEGLPIPALQQRVDELLRARTAGDVVSATDNEAVHFELPAGRFLTANLAPPAKRADALGVVIVVSDVTEIMRLERVRRDFVSNVSHELRTPLTAVAGYAETLMLSEDLQPEYRNFAGVIHKHAAALGGIINDLLELARLEDAREAVTLRPTDAGEILEETLENFREIAAAKKFSFETALADVPVLADTPLLARVFGNLLENACRYSPPGGVVRILSRREGREVIFIVSDNGPGIPKEALPRIFERFYQVKKERNSGTAGIGLAVCKHIIERHRGRIWAESPCGAAAAAILFTLAPADEEKAGTGNFS
jgi:two-component system phosphate regulon sensor histidine kinase PhoR